MPSGKAWIGREISDILTVFSALEDAGSAASFLGFDPEPAEQSQEPFEGEHFQNLAGWLAEFELEHWPRNAHGRNLRRYRRLVEEWKRLGSPLELDRSQRLRLELVWG